MKIVKIIENGEVYSCYKEWIEHNFKSYLKYFKYGKTPNVGEICRVIGSSKHLMHNNRIIHLVQNVKTNIVYMIDELGLETIGSDILELE